MVSKFQIESLRRVFKNIEPRFIGRNHVDGVVDKGFYCGDLTIIHPDLGPCSAEYHLASDLYPNERKLLPIKESRRIYVDDPFFGMSLGGPFGNGTKIYNPQSQFVDFDDINYIKKETSLRHLAAYIYNIFRNMTDICPFNNVLYQGFKILEEVFENNMFILPDDDRERDFYQNLIKDLIINLKKYKEDVNQNFGSMMAFSSRFNISHYDEIVKNLFDLIDENKDQIFTNNDE